MLLWLMNLPDAPAGGTASVVVFTAGIQDVWYVPQSTRDWQVPDAIDDWNVPPSTSPWET